MQVTRDVRSRFDPTVRSRARTTEAADTGNDNDGSDGDDEDGDFSFWPSESEFKDLLLDESRMRVELVGDWMTPFGL